MNDRIKELAEQADAFDDAMDVGGKSYIGLRDEYFAKLIVKECGVALSPMLRDMISRGQAYDIIKEHFGVES